MLDLMRRKKRLRLILWLVIAALALSMLVFFVPGTNMDGFFSAPGVVASVDNRSVTAQDFSQAYQRVAREIRTANNMDAETIRSMGVPNQVLEDLISFEIVEVLAKRFGISLTGDEMLLALENNQNFLSDGEFIGVENYKALLAMYGYTASEFEGMMRRQMLRDKVREFLTSAIRVNEHELRDNYRKSTERIRIDYVLFKRDEFKRRVKPTATDVETWFNDHRDAYTVKEKRNAEYILIPFTQFIPRVEVTEDDILAEWDSMSRGETVEAAHILFRVDDASDATAVRQKAEEVLKMAQSGQDFSDLARKYSEDPGSAEQGGYLGPFSRGQMVPEFEAAAFALKAGELSGLVRSEFGYHIIKSLWYEKPTLESSREELSAIARDRKLMDLMIRKAETAGAEAAKHADLSEVAKNLDFTVEIRETGLLGKDDAAQAPSLSPLIIDELFSLREIGSIGKPVEHELGLAIPRLSVVELPRPGTFEDFRQQVEDDYIAAKAVELMEAQAEKLSVEGIEQANLATVARAQGFSVGTSDEFTLNEVPNQEIGTNPAFNQAVFAVETGAVSTPRPVQENIIVFQVKSRSPFDEAAFEDQKTVLRTQTLQTRQDTYFQEYVNRVREEMTKAGKITINRRSLEQASLYF